MKKTRLLHFLRYLSIVNVALLCNSCNNELIVNDEWRDIAYVYGLLDHTADTQFIRIGKAFLADEAPSRTAQNPDSIYYAEDLLVYLIELNTEGNEVRRFILDKWDRPGKLKPGNFADDKHHLYITEEKLNPQYTYRLEFEKPNGELVWVETPLVNWGNDPRGGFRTPFANIQQLAFGETYLSSPENPFPHSSTSFSWIAPNFGRFYDFNLHFHYIEMRFDTRQTENKKLTYRMMVPERRAAIDPAARLPVMENFLLYLNNNIDKDPNILRIIDYFTIEVHAGSEELQTYINLHKPAVGITQERPQYTNIEGGVGIFSSRASTFFEFTHMDPPSIGISNIHPQNFRSLVVEACDLNFARIHMSDTCYCDNGQIVRLNVGGSTDCLLRIN